MLAALTAGYFLGGFIADRTVSDNVAANSAQLVFDRRGELLAAAGADGGLRVFEVAAGVLLSAQAGHEGRAHAVALGGSGVLAATGGEDRTVRLWSPFAGRETQVLRGHSGTVRGLAGAFGMAGVTDLEMTTFTRQATDQLKIAFDCTLVALLLSLVLMYLVHMVQRAEEVLVVDSQEYCQEHLLLRLYDPAATESA